MFFSKKPIIIRQRGIWTEDFQGRAAFLARVRKCQKEARRLFPKFRLKDEELPVVFVRSGRIAGMAKKKGKVYNLEFNVEAILKDPEEMLKNTIPHEMAHVVDMVLHHGKSNHGPRWQAIVTALGGSTDRLHDIPLTKSRQTTRYIYQASCGTEIILGPRYHHSIQRGRYLIIKKTGGLIRKENFTGKVVRN